MREPTPEDYVCDECVPKAGLQLQGSYLKWYTVGLPCYCCQRQRSKVMKVRFLVADPHVKEVEYGR